MANQGYMLRAFGIMLVSFAGTFGGLSLFMLPPETPNYSLIGFCGGAAASLTLTGGLMLGAGLRQSKKK